MKSHSNVAFLYFPMMNKVEFGVVFSGGGLLGAAHIGAIRALEELKITPGVIAGASIGAVIGAFYSSGMNSEELEKAFSKVSITSLIGWGLPNKGIIDLNKLRPFFTQYLTDQDILDLPIPLHISVTNVLTGKNEIIQHGSLYDYLIATCAIPAMFKPSIINDMMYIDGGVTNNLPVSAIRKNCHHLLAIDLRHVEPIEMKQVNSASQIVQRAIVMSLHQKASQEMKLADIQVPISGIDQYSMFKNNNVLPLISIGYSQTMSALRAYLDQ